MNQGIDVEESGVSEPGVMPHDILDSIYTMTVNYH